MVMNDAAARPSRASTMSAATASAPVAPGSVAPTPANKDDTGSTITVNTSKTAGTNFPPPKTDKPRPHVCQTCQRSFARLEHLKRHERSHTKEKPFECPECARCFARRDLLLRHQQKLHQTATPSRPRNRRESGTSTTPGQSRARKNSVASTNTAVSNSTMRPRANTISHVDGTAMQMIAAANASVARAVPTTHSRHPSLAGLPMHGFDNTFGGMAAAMGQRGMQHGLPKLETAQMSNSDFVNGLRTAPPMPVFNNNEFDFEGLYLGAGSTTINPNALHYNESPQPLGLDQASPFGSNLHDFPSSQTFDDGIDWLTGFDHQMSIQGAETAVDESSPSAISTASQSGISDVMLDGSNHPAPVGTSAMWQPSIMGPPQLSNPFAMDLNGSVFPDLLNGAPMSPQPATQKISDPYFSTPPSLSPLNPSLVSGFNAASLNQPFGFSAGQEAPSSLQGGHYIALAVTTITDATRMSIVNTLSQCLPFGGRKHPFTSQGSPHPPQTQTSGYKHLSASVPSSAGLQRYVVAYLNYFHPHLPFLHIPTLSFESELSPSGHVRGVGGSGCLLLSIAAIGALYEMEHEKSRVLFEMAKKMIFFYLEERRKADVRKADGRRGSFTSDQHPPASDGSAHTPVWLVQAMLLNVVYGHNCGDKTASDIASTHCAALVSLAQGADLLKPSTATSTERHDAHMADAGDWQARPESELQHEWLQWKAAEERKRTLYVVFIMSSLLVSAYNHTPALTNSEIFLDLPCDEDYFSAPSSEAFHTKGGPQAAAHNRSTFHDALGELLRTNERQQRQAAPSGSELPHIDLRPSTFGCLVLINALHNYIWETRQRHHNKIWTNEETEKMHRHIEPALKAWQAAWLNNPEHSLERPNPAGKGPISADAIPLLDLAYVRLFVNLSRSKEKFWQRDWDGVAEELARGQEIIQHAENSPESNSSSTGLGAAAVIGADPSDNSMPSSEPDGSPATQTPMGDLPKGEFPAAPVTISRRERHLRKAAFYAADSLARSDKLGVTFADYNSRELPLQSAMCAFDCAQVLAEWIATLQDRCGRYLGVLGHDSINLESTPAVFLLEEYDVQLLNKVQEIVRSAEMKINMDQFPHGGVNSMETRLAMDGHNGYATKILRVTAYMLNRSAVWPVLNLIASCLEAHANHTRARAEKSVAVSE